MIATPSLLYLCILLVLTSSIRESAAWNPTTGRRSNISQHYPSPQLQQNPSLDRRGWFRNTITLSTLLIGTTSRSTLSHAEVVRAVGSGELNCREKGNCLEVGELDGALGWNWGAPDRCDPSDPLCGNDGRRRETPLVGQPLPEPLSDITHVGAVQLEIGRGEVGVLRMGFYGNAVPGGVEQMLSLLSSGISTATTKNPNNVIGMEQAPVSLRTGGILNSITPGVLVDFGVPSQVNAYARSRGRAKAGDFLPQQRPDPNLLTNEVSRLHTTAGLVSIPKKGIGYGGSGFQSDDEAFESSFLVTLGAAPSLDKNRLVVGQLLDAQSMAFLERLGSLPTKKGITGVLPGQSSGPPLLKVVVRETETSKVVKGPPR